MVSEEVRASYVHELGHEMANSSGNDKRLLSSDDSKKVSVTFDMNRLQRIPGPGEPRDMGRVLVSMNPTHTPKGIKGTYTYHHPLFSSSSFQAATKLHLVNGVSDVSFAGAWMGYGFHEDGFVAGLRAAQNVLGIPYREHSVSKLSNSDALTRRPCIDMMIRVLIRLVQSLIWAVERLAK